MVCAQLTLSSAPIGRQFRIRHLHSQAEVSARLREMGFCENTIVRCIMKGDGNVICEVRNSRVGLNDVLADSIILAAHE